MSKEDQLLITLMKLQCNFTVGRPWLALRSATHHGVEHSPHMDFQSFTKFSSKGMLPEAPPTVAKNRLSLPASFLTFTSCRMIVDCTEVEVAVPSRMEANSHTYSHYKHHNTLKALVGVAPNGVLTYVSKLYPGSTSDKEIVRHCKVLDKMLPSDVVLADTGFLIQYFDVKRGEFDTPQFIPTHARVTAGLHAQEFTLSELFNDWKLYGNLTRIPYQFRVYATEIFQVCARTHKLYESPDQEGSCEM